MRRRPTLHAWGWAIAFWLAGTSPALAQGYTVGGSRPGADLRLKIHADLTETAKRDVVTLPKIGLAIPAGRTLEIGVDVAIRHILPAKQDRASDVADAEVKAKLLLIDAQDTPLGVDASAELKVSLPVGSARRGFGEGVPGVKLPITFSRRSGPWEFGGLLGAQMVYDRDKTMLLAGALVTREMGGGIKIGGEVATEMHARRSREQEIMANAGFRYAPRPGTDWFVIVGRSLVSRDGQPVMRIKLGFEITLKRRSP